MANLSTALFELPYAIREITIIGCGGTGAYLAELICRMIQGFRLDMTLTLYDGDRVESVNVTRQNFLPVEIGQNKAESLALRLSGQFGMAVRACPRHYGRGDSGGYAELLITATDSLWSRRQVATTQYSHWLDVGNAETSGQAVYGTTHSIETLGKEYRAFGRRAVRFLPTAAAVNPAILKARQMKSPDGGCAAMPFMEQGFGVNLFAASAAAMIAKQVAVDRCVRTPSVYFNLATGWMRPCVISRVLFEAWKKRN